MLLARPGMLDRWRLNGEAIGSPPSSVGIGERPSGGVPASAEVELMDLGVPAGESSCRMKGVLRVDEGSPRGSAECCRLSCG